MSMEAKIVGQMIQKYGYYIFEVNSNREFNEGRIKINFTWIKR